MKEIKDRVFSTNNFETEDYQALFERNEYELLISIFNNQLLTHRVNDYLFRSDQAVGVRALKLYLKLLQDNEKYTCIEYTNQMNPICSNRIIQNVWVFANKHDCKKFVKQYQEQGYTHLIMFNNYELAKNIDNLDNFVKDEYFNHDRLSYLNNYFMVHTDEMERLKEHKLYQLLKVHLFSNNQIEAAIIKSKRSTANSNLHQLPSLIVQYNTDAEIYITRKQAANLKDPVVRNDFIIQARRLKSRYNDIKPQADIAQHYRRLHLPTLDIQK